MAGEPLQWRRLYVAAALGGGAVGLLVVLQLFPAIPPQVTAWMNSVDETEALMVSSMVGALVGLALAAVAHLGVVLQLRHRSGPRTDKP